MKPKDILKVSKGMPVKEKKAALLGKQINEKKEIVYAFRINPNTADPQKAVTYLMDAVGMTPAHMGDESFDCGSWADAFFMPRPCMLRYDGTVAYYLDPDDYSKKSDGTPSDISDPDFPGNAMMEWGLIWYKFEAGDADGEGYFYCSNKQADKSYHCWCNYDERGNIIPHFYTAVYNGTIVDGRLRSLSDITLPRPNEALTNVTEEVEYAAANNSGSAVEWYTDVFCDRQLINALTVLVGKSLDTQSTFGRGKSSGNTRHTTGSLNDKGLFYGNVSSGDMPVKVFGMENWWGYAFHRTAGLIRSKDGHYLYKLTYSTADGSEAHGYDRDGTGYIDSGSGITTTFHWITKMRFGEYGMLPSATRGWRDKDANAYSDTYYCDPEIHNEGSYNGYPLIGGQYNYQNQCGAFSLALHFDSELRSPDTFTTLSCKPCR